MVQQGKALYVGVSSYSARKARELHALSLEIEQSVFTTTEKDALHLKVTAAFGALNATAPVAHPKGRFTLLPRAGGSLLRSAAALGVLGVLAVSFSSQPARQRLRWTLGHLCAICDSTS